MAKVDRGVFSLKNLKRIELGPLIAFVSGGAVLCLSMSLWAFISKPDVKFLRFTETQRNTRPFDHFTDKNRTKVFHPAGRQTSGVPQHIQHILKDINDTTSR